MRRLKRSTEIALFGALSAVALWGKSACEVIPIDDAVVILSQNAMQHDLGTSGCAYEVGPPRLVLMVTPPQEASGAKKFFAESKETAKRAGAVVAEEKAISEGSFSVVTKDQQAIYIVSGDIALTMTLSNPGSSTPLPDLMRKMRDIAKRAVWRLEH